MQQKIKLKAKKYILELIKSRSKAHQKNMSRELLTNVKHFSKTISQEIFMVFKITENNCLS